MIPVLLCGGSGTRLWPLSRSKMPKQFVSLLERSLFELTVRRLQPLGDPYVVAVKEFESLTHTFASKMNLQAEHILTEPLARNTAPAVALLCRYLQLRGLQSEIAGIFPADHVIGDEPTFMKAIEAAVVQARAGGIVTLGITPNQPATGFGYIELDGAKPVGETPQALKSIRFREKPDLETAKEYLSSGRFVWNAGIFVFKVDSLISMFAELAPTIWNPLQDLKADLSNLTEIYSRLPSISFDYAIMEKTKDQYCVPCDPQWSDLGSWDDVVDFSGDEDGIHIPNLAHTYQSQSPNCFGYSEKKKVISFLNVENVVAIDTSDALLIYKRGHSQNVRDIVEQLKQHGRVETEDHSYELRPWGRYETLHESQQFKSKLIEIAPGSHISYQSHSKRSEHWVVVGGVGEVTLDAESLAVSVGSTVSIPAGKKHRLRNTGDVPLEVVEVQIGNDISEQDIQRFDS